ncbi:hypothetical protein JY432_02175 [Stenotrophomonas maltophilia]|nr:hypothetical protein [Stenotrophomonas maltophilia]
MSNDKTTLADLQPGGRVRLGDRATIEKQARELLAKEWETLSFDAPVEELREGCELPPVVAAGVRAIVAALSAHPFPDGQRDNSDLLAGLRDVEEHLYCAGSNPSHTETVRAAINALSAQSSPATCKECLQAQPFPGGQDARAQFEEYRGGDCERDAQGYYVNARTAQDWAMWQAALAARQPVASNQQSGNSGELDVDGARQPVWEPAIWVSPGQLVAHKDRVPGDGGAYLPARLTRDGQFTKPLYAVPAQAVDLGQQQDAARWRAIAPHLSVEWDEDEMLKRWTWIDFKGDALSVPTRSRESYASVEEAIDAVIDSQAVGNG